MNEKINLGRVGFVPQGAYDPNVTYGKLSVVTYRNNTYCSRKEGNIGHEPVGDDEWWHLLIDAQTAYEGATAAAGAAKRANDAADEAERINASAQKAEEQRVSNETARQTAETERVNGEETRRTAEQERGSSEEARKRMETQRLASEQLRTEAESMRKSDEAKRIGNETARQTAEQARAEAETGRRDAETERINAETARAGAEVKREKDTKDGIVSMQTATETAIDQLHDYESVVEKKEALRVTAEIARAEAESTRAEAEAGRVKAETERAKTSAESVKAADAAAQKATAAATAATTAGVAAEKVNAELTADNVFEVTDRTGAKKSIDITPAAELTSVKADTARIQQTLGAYSDRADIVLVQKYPDQVVNKDGVKVDKTGWAMAEFTAELGNEYLFKPGATDGDVCVFAEYIDKIERRAIEYAYTYDEQGRTATATATYDGMTHTYTYTYTAQESTAAAGTETQSEVCVITDDQTGQTVDYLPATFQTKVGSYQPLTLLNADAELPIDGYCRFVSNFQVRSAIKVAVSYKMDVADLTMKVVRDGMTASMCTQLSKINQKVDEAKAGIETMRSEMENNADYFVGENDEKTGDPHFLNCKGNKEFLGEWHPFLIDHTDNGGEATHPVGQLMDNNHFRFTTGAFAPTVGITEEMRAACDVQLYTDPEHTQKLTLKNGVVVTDKAGAHPYDAVEVYNSLGLVTLYDGEGNRVRQLLPWETTETKYSVMIGRYDTLYPIDRQTGDSGKVLSGVFRRSVRYDGIDTGRFPLLGTALAPCPVTTVGNKTRNFFYAYAVGSSNTVNGAGAYGADSCSMYVDDGRTYPHISDMRQISNMQRARANNADANAPYPFAEGGYHAINTFTLCMELLYGTKYLHQKESFASGISSNDSVRTEEAWQNYGGVRVKEQGTAEWVYRNFGDSTPFGCNAKMEKQNFSYFINSYRPKEQCMESQMAASWAAEFGVAEDIDFEAYGTVYHYRNIPGAKGLADGVMNCKVYRKKTGTCKGYKDADTPAIYDLELSLRMSLIHGMNTSGDIYAYWGGGCEMVGTSKSDDPNVTNRNKVNYIDLYIEPNQAKWLNETSYTKNNLGTFGFEAVYAKLGTIGPPIPSSGYMKKRFGFTPFTKESGGNLASWQCCFGDTNTYWSGTIDQRLRIALRLRGAANYALCSRRFLHAFTSAAITSLHVGGSAQCRIVQ